MIWMPCAGMCGAGSGGIRRGIGRSIGREASGIAQEGMLCIFLECGLSDGMR